MQYAVRSLKTGSFVLDNCTGVGGFPFGYITEIYGPPQGGRSSIVLSCIRSNQDNIQPILIDTEFKFDGHYAKKMNVDLSRLFLVQTSLAKDVISVLGGIKEQEPCLIVIDSLAPLGDRKTIGKVLAAMGEAAGNKHCVVYTNQIRYNVRSNEMEGYGGSASVFHPILRIWIGKPRSITGPGGRVGTTSEVSITKSSIVANGTTSTNVDIYYGKGFWPEMEILEAAVSLGYISKKGSWYYYNELCLGEGRWSAVETLSKLPLMKSIASVVIKEMNRAKTNNH